MSHQDFFSCDFERCLLSFVYMYFISVELRSYAAKIFQNFAKFTATNMQIKEWVNISKLQKNFLLQFHYFLQVDLHRRRHRFLKICHEKIQEISRYFVLFLTETMIGLEKRTDDFQINGFDGSIISLAFIFSRIKWRNIRNWQKVPVDIRLSWWCFDVYLKFNVYSTYILQLKL